MKSYLSFLQAAIGCLIVFLFLGSAVAGQADWKVLREDSYHNKFSYDAASVKHTASDTVTVWAQSDAAKYLYEIDCKNRKARLLEGVGSAESKWFAIQNGSGDDLLYKAVCP